MARVGWVAKRWRWDGREAGSRGGVILGSASGCDCGGVSGESRGACFVLVYLVVDQEVAFGSAHGKLRASLGPFKKRRVLHHGRSCCVG